MFSKGSPELTWLIRNPDRLWRCQTSNLPCTWQLCCHRSYGLCENLKYGCWLLGRSWRSLLWSWGACWSRRSLQTRSWSVGGVCEIREILVQFFSKIILLSVLSCLSGFVCFCFGKSCSRWPLRRLRSITKILSFGPLLCFILVTHWRIETKYG